MPSKISHKSLSRRRFLQAVAGGTAAHTLGLKAAEGKELVSGTAAPPPMKAGLWTVFATTCRECPAGCGMQVRCRDSRVIKAEGNPDHPVSQGGLCPRGQSAPQGLYDPDRLQVPYRRGDDTLLPSTRWNDIEEDIASALSNARRVTIISGLKTGAEAEILQQFCDSQEIPAQLHFYEAIHYNSLRRANEKLFSEPIIPYYRLDQSEFILNFGADFLEYWISNVQFTQQFTRMHHQVETPEKGPVSVNGEMAFIGPRLSMTATNADYFHQVPRGSELPIALAVLYLIVNGGNSNASDDLKSLANEYPLERLNLGGISRETLQTYADKLVGSKGIVLAGSGIGNDPYNEQLCTVAMLINIALGNVGGNIDFSMPHALSRTVLPDQMETVFDNILPDEMVYFVDCNPAFTMPWRKKDIDRLTNSVYIGTMMNETAALCRWVLPAHSPLESWGDYEPYPGIASLMQPCMHPMYDTRSMGDIFLKLAQKAGNRLTRNGQEADDFLGWLRLRWQELARSAGEENFQRFWRRSLQKGFAIHSTGKDQSPSFNPQSAALPAVNELESPEGMNLTVWPSIRLFDGRTANRPWIQEIPEPVSFISWQAWADVAPNDAQRLNLENGDLVAIQNQTGKVTLPARVTEDVSEGTVSVVLGQGHRELGKVATGIGDNAYQLLNGPASGPVKITKTGGNLKLIFLSATRSQHDRDVFKWVRFDELKSLEPEPLIWPLPRGYIPSRDLYPPHEYPNHRWAMVIDLDKCIGCGACSVACYAENNISIMGPDPLLEGRELAWLKIIPYEDPEDKHRIGHLHAICQHCDAAPCEPVCPVFAAVHNEEGLNAQIYNRCIGTRYCSNNCPYKVRRFNWFNPKWRAPLELQMNPDVTARCRGVMEKCTFCIQRIQYAEHQATVEDRPVRDGEIQPACVQSCPAEVFTFGDLMDENSKVYKLFHHPRRYQLLQDLNTKPAVVYLKRMKP